MKTIYITIDDAPSPAFRQKLDYLESQNIPAVFFCQGVHMQQNRKIMVEALKRGFPLQNHSWDHPRFSELSLKDCRDQIHRTHKLLLELYAEAKVPWKNRFFRFPYGDKGTAEEGSFNAAMNPMTEMGRDRKAHLQYYLKELDYTAPQKPKITYHYYEDSPYSRDVDVLWTYDSYDWAVGMESPPFGLCNIEALLVRMDEDVPEDERGLNTPDTDDIFLCHDFPGVEELFEPLIEKLKTKADRFGLLE